MLVNIHANNHRALGLVCLPGRWEAKQARPLSILFTYVDQMPRESFLESGSGVDDEVNGPSAGSLISTIYKVS